MLFVASQLYSGIQIHLLKRRITDDKNTVCTQLKGTSIPVRQVELDSEPEQCSDSILARPYILNSD